MNEKHVDNKLNSAKFGLRPMYFDCTEFIGANGRKRTVRVVIAPNTVSPHNRIPNGTHISYFCNYGKACHNRACDFCRNGRSFQDQYAANRISEHFLTPSRSLALDNVSSIAEVSE